MIWSAINHWPWWRKAVPFELLVKTTTRYIPFTVWLPFAFFFIWVNIRQIQFIGCILVRSHYPWRRIQVNDLIHNSSHTIGQSINKRSDEVTDEDHVTNLHPSFTLDRNLYPASPHSQYSSGSTTKMPWNFLLSFFFIQRPTNKGPRLRGLFLWPIRDFSWRRQASRTSVHFCTNMAWTYIYAAIDTTTSGFTQVSHQTAWASGCSKLG